MKPYRGDVIVELIEIKRQIFVSFIATRHSGPGFQLLHSRTTILGNHSSPLNALSRIDGSKASSSAAVSA